MQTIIISGFGGQGILSMGRLLATAGLHEGLNVSWLPSYGPEMRGGTANCHVIISREEVASPIISKPSALIVMNQPSLEKFEDLVQVNGMIIRDKSLVPEPPKRKDIRCFSLPAIEKAQEMGNNTFGGIVLLGKFIEECGIIKKESFEGALRTVLREGLHYLIPEEMKALEFGMSYPCD